MGMEFILKIKDSFEKALDESRVKLGTPDLFTRKANALPRTYLVKLHKGRFRIENHEYLLVSLLENGRIMIMDGLEEIGELVAPTDELVDALKASGSECCGKVADFYESTQMADVELW